MSEIPDIILEKLLKKKTQLDASIKKRMALQKERDRKADTRRKIIIGGVCLNFMEEDEQLREKVIKKVKSTVKPEDFERLFGLKEQTNQNDFPSVQI